MNDRRQAPGSTLGAFGLVTPNGMIRDWSTLLIRVEQMGTAPRQYNRIMVMYGDHVHNATEGNTNVFDQVRRSSVRDGLDLNGDGALRLPWPAREVEDGTDAQQDYFTAVEWVANTGDGATRHSERIGGTDRYVYIHTRIGQNLYRASGALEAGLHAWGKNLEGKVYFDDWGVRELN